eukprot:Selendium_serpulae@DN6487_c3_g4_i1.p1
MGETGAGKVSDWNATEAQQKCTIASSSSLPPMRKAYFKQIGLEFIAQKKLALLLMAGGQGTRLGFDAPKGMFPIGPLSNKTLFQIFIERATCLKKLAIKATGGKEPVSLPLVIMTSDTTSEKTELFLKSNNYFGYAKEDILFFQQQMVPSTDNNGAFLISPEHKLVQNPNGNGGIFKSLEDSGVLGNLNKRGCEAIHVFGVDNVLVKLGDPLFIGYCVDSGAPVGNKCCAKNCPEEKVGVFCCREKADKQTECCVREYSEISEELSKSRGGDGQLVFSAGNIANHFFTTEFVKKVNDSGFINSNYHIAEKKIPFMEGDGKVVLPESPNGIKLESFVFDSFAMAPRVVGFEIERDSEFAPIKNKTGVDSPDSARELISKLHSKFLTEAGAKIK